MQDANAQDTGVQDHNVVQDRCHQRDAEVDCWVPSQGDIIQVRRHGVGQVWQGTLARLLYMEQGDTWRQHQGDIVQRVSQVPKGPIC